jgi:hypothetical protein
MAVAQAAHAYDPAGMAAVDLDGLGFGMDGIAQFGLQYFWPGGLDLDSVPADFSSTDWLLTPDHQSSGTTDGCEGSGGPQSF